VRLIPLIWSLIQEAIRVLQDCLINLSKIRSNLEYLNRFFGGLHRHIQSVSQTRLPAASKTVASKRWNQTELEVS
jgi:hemerythrin-like domain-containing protein